MLVVKIGGGGGLDLDACCDDLARLHAAGEGVVLVHGGSGPATQLGEALDYPPRFITTPSGMQSRYTDQRTLEIFTMALAGLNAELVARLNARGVPALGLSGCDGRVLSGRRKETVIAVQEGRRQVLRDDRSGSVEAVNGTLLQALLTAGYLPVVSPPAWSLDGPINVDADRAAALVATTLGAETLILLTNVPGLLRDRLDPTSLLPHVALEDLDDALTLAAGRMRIKLHAAQSALQGGVARVVIGDGRCATPIARALEGAGTVLTTTLPDRGSQTATVAMAGRRVGSTTATLEAGGKL